MITQPTLPIQLQDTSSQSYVEPAHQIGGNIQILIRSHPVTGGGGNFLYAFGIIQLSISKHTELERDKIVDV